MNSIDIYIDFPVIFMWISCDPRNFFWTSKRWEFGLVELEDNFGADFTFLVSCTFACRFRWSLFDKSEKSLAESLPYVREVRSFSFFVSRARLFGKTQKYNCWLDNCRLKTREKKSRDSSFCVELSPLSRRSFTLLTRHILRRYFLPSVLLSWIFYVCFAKTRAIILY